ncbi:MAG: Mov34/MPN/PAD-1 family protein, partial [Candidatus Methylomirabilis sp.]|nr:Mov34/MPN/PAD-1 family protein [Deltaproteobacteria bacterium]
YHGTSGEPFVEGFHVALAAPEAAVRTATFRTAYFLSEVDRALSDLVREGKLAPGEDVRYLVSAVRRALPEAPRRAFVFDDDEEDAVADAGVRVVPGDLGALAATSAAVAPEAERPEDLPVFVHDRVLREMVDRTLAEPERETGGVLIGYLRRDGASGDLLVEITAQIPARYSEADALSLAFKAETWFDAKNALALRGTGETMLGFWHSHIPKTWCAKCPIERRRVCRFATPFFSAADIAFQRAAFARAFCPALVVTDGEFGPPDVSAFGWRGGRIEHRGYRVVREPAVLNAKGD